MDTYPEGHRVVLPVICELGAEPDQRPVEPAQDIARLLALGPVHRKSGHQDSSGLLVERRRDRLLHLRGRVPAPAERRDAHAVPATRVLVRSDELQMPFLTYTSMCAGRKVRVLGAQWKSNEHVLTSFTA